jgi:hypothetical protein
VCAETQKSSQHCRSHPMTIPLCMCRTTQQCQNADCRQAGRLGVDHTCLAASCKSPVALVSCAIETWVLQVASVRQSNHNQIIAAAGSPQSMFQ